MRRNAASTGALLALGLAIAAVPTPASAAQQTVVADDVALLGLDLGALHVSVTTDTLAGEQAEHYQTLAGDPVQRVYALRNTGLLALRGVGVHDPEASGAAIRCGPSGSRTITTLLPGRTVTCSATFTAVPGTHDATVTASGSVLLLLRLISLFGEDRAGYTAVVPPTLHASLSLGSSGANLPAGEPAPAKVTVSNGGSTPLRQVAPVGSQPLANYGCDGGGATIAELGGGQSAVCEGALTPQVGQHVSSLTIAGNWLWESPLTTQGPQSSRTIRVQTVASAQYNGVPVSSPSPQPPPVGASPSPVPPPPPTPGAPTPTLPGPVAVVPPSTQPPSVKPPSPSAAPVAAATPSTAILQPVSQFHASRGLSLPLKVLVIIIIPAAAAAAGARRISSRR